MPILTLQRRLRELGRIRLGISVPTGRTRGNGQSINRPEKLDRFRVTSTSRPLIARVAELYGGEVKDWDNNGVAQFEVITTATRLPILIPPQPVSQYYEHWSGGGCQRRCDGETELLSDQPCLCDSDPSKRLCKPTTRLNVILRDVEGIGVWRLESHGYYSAIELPDVADLLARAGGYVAAWLSLEQRSALREGKIQRWIVPTLEVDITPAALLAGKGAAPRGALDPSSAALPITASTSTSADQVAEWVGKVNAAVTVEALVTLWRGRPMKDLPPDAVNTFTSRAAHLRAQEAGELSASEESVQEASVPSPPEGNVDALWMQILSSVPEDWSTIDVERHFTEVTGVQAEIATAEDMHRYLAAAGDAA